VITTRLQELTELGKSFLIQKLIHKDAIKLLLQSIGFSAEDITRLGIEHYQIWISRLTSIDITNLASLLDGLSLAIVIAGAFMRHTGTSAKEYLELY
jgi:hypothetical protein